MDATAGNGHDTLFLCHCVGEEGSVWAFDVQQAALTATRSRLQQADIAESVYHLVHDGHEHLDRHLPADLAPRACLFNLGYLPGSDKSVITETPRTLRAVQAALTCLAPGGLLTIVVYPGHEGGAEEGRAIAEWASGLDPRAFEAQHLRPVNRAASPPECWAVWKRDRPA